MRPWGWARPSIYNAFGDKEALFLRALQRYRETVGSAPLRAMHAHVSVQDGLDAFFGQIVKYRPAIGHTLDACSAAPPPSPICPTYRPTSRPTSRPARRR